MSRKSDKLGKQQNVDSPHSCQEICAETPNCLYWTWLEKKKRKKVKQICKLRSGVRKSGFRRQKDKAVSGTYTNSSVTSLEQLSHEPLFLDSLVQIKL